MRAAAGFTPEATRIKIRRCCSEQTSPEGIWISHCRDGPAAFDCSHLRTIKTACCATGFTQLRHTLYEILYHICFQKIKNDFSFPIKDQVHFPLYYTSFQLTDWQTA